MTDSTRKISDQGLEQLKHWESVEPEMYHDVAGLPTIGVGHLLTRSELTSGKIMIDGAPARWADGLSDQQIDALLRQDLAKRERFVNREVAVSLTDNQFDALVVFVFNIGRNAFRMSTLLRKLNMGQYGDVPAQFRRWIYSGGRRVQGLVNRREATVELWQEVA